VVLVLLAPVLVGGFFGGLDQFSDAFAECKPSGVDCVLRAKGRLGIVGVLTAVPVLSSVAFVIFSSFDLSSFVIVADVGVTSSLVFEITSVVVDSLFSAVGVFFCRIISCTFYSRSNLYTRW